MPQFELNSVYKPLADQPKAISELSEGLSANEYVVAEPPKFSRLPG